MRFITGTIVFMMTLTIIGASMCFYYYSSSLIPEQQDTTAQFNRLSASMRHTFKAGSLNHKAFDAYLAALLKNDQALVQDSIDFMNASLGFIDVGYFENKQLVERVTPIIEETVKYVKVHQSNNADEVLEKVRTYFNHIFLELQQIEQEIYIDTQKLFSIQQMARKKWQYFYIFLFVTALFGIFSIALLAYKQRKLINDLKENDQKLRVHISQRRQAEEEKEKLTEQLYQAKKMESIGLMVGGVAHDLNNILSGIVGYPELLLMDLPDDSALRKPIEAMKDSGKRAALVVEDLLTVARGVANIKRQHNLISIAKEYFDSPEFKKLKSLYPSVSFKPQFDDEPLWILCSSVHVKKCIMNLVTNAAESIVGEGNVVISASKQYVAQNVDNETGGAEGGEFVILSILDSGPGVSSKDLNHIFEPFYTKKKIGRSGTGLGLTVVWNTMEDHKGKVTVEKTDRGTCFCLFFPMSEEKSAKQVAIDEKKHQYGNGEHILVIDDEQQLRDLSSEMLRTMGYVVDSVPSGEKAIAFLKENPVDLLVLDMLMEPGMNGCKTYEEILKLYPVQKAIIASGFSESDDVRKTLKLGASQFIKKPYSMNQLSRAVKETLRS